LILVPSSKKPASGKQIEGAKHVHNERELNTYIMANVKGDAKIATVDELLPRGVYGEVSEMRSYESCQSTAD
jgi:hypothetical protein